MFELEKYNDALKIIKNEKKEKLYVKYYLGVYFSKNHENKDTSEALKILNEIKYKYPKAFLGIGNIYFYNSINYKKALENYTLCHELANNDLLKNKCLYFTGYILGNHGDQDISKALKILNSIKKDFPRAYFAIAEIYYHDLADYKEAFENYSLCAKFENDEQRKNACNAMRGYFYYYGHYVEKNPLKAIEIYDAIKKIIILLILDLELFFIMMIVICKIIKKLSIIFQNAWIQKIYQFRLQTNVNGILLKCINLDILLNKISIKHWKYTIQ